MFFKLPVRMVAMKNFRKCFKLLSIHTKCVLPDGVTSLMFAECQNFFRQTLKLERNPKEIFENEIKVVSVPQLAESISEGDIRWEKAVGDAVKEDEVIGEIETDKSKRKKMNAS
ncbi:dihydrolipoyllysine-residue succinyltransferase component of 2-oxoglutarate dehydrogenase complex-like protein [Leptotrombidium deliense]|uniref:Dihydrolipoyllysine-residue succinyltransferase component of 2-oxoglutarate dehydrogenase complex-like protein n=1 Tax=Leptotrombidium deliense TaxID=299467 RepID=A0A443SLI6_9ACAR|nr:dihydrolipoyllysine-residue succinyltransferase component of 2-oxoglutarate dehydrogenase complex-like protein [Leptotrombidium deliense]